MLNIIAFTIIITALAVIISIFYHKLPLLEKIDLDVVDVEKKKKYKLLEERLKRRILELTKKIKFTHSIQSATRALSALKGIRSHIKRKKTSYISTVQTAHEQKNGAEDDENILEKAYEFLKSGKFQEAEQTVLDIVKNNPRSLKAYKLLADVYQQTKEFIHAEATYEHIVKLAERLKEIKAFDYLHFAEIKARLEKFEDALQNVQKALLLEPQNPKILHFIVQMAIKTHQKELAWKYYRKLKETNEDNQSLEELLQELKKL